MGTKSPHQETLPPILPRRPLHLRPHGSRRSPEDKINGGFKFNLSEILQRRNLRFMLNEYRRHEHRRLSETNRSRHLKTYNHQSSPTHVCNKGSSRRSHRILSTVQVNRTMAENEEETASKRAQTIAGAKKTAGRTLRVHTLRLLQHRLSFLLVEPRRVLRPFRTHPRLSLDIRQPR